MVTGGGGFIGSNLVEELHEKNDLVVIDDFSTGKKENLKNFDVEIIESSITDFESVRKAVEAADYVFHLAALPSVPRSIKDPLKTNEINVTGTLNILIASKENDVKKVVYASSSSVYGDTPTLPKVETMTTTPLSPYAVSKLTSEYYCKVFYRIYGLPTTVVRYFNVYGPRQDPESEYAAVIPKFISKIMNDQSPEIYGDGEQTRDFTYVKDAVSGTILAGESNDSSGEIFNIAGGSRIAINDLATKIKGIIGKEIDNINLSPRKGDVKHSLADITKAKDLLGYEPGYQIDEGLSAVVKHYN